MKSDRLVQWFAVLLLVWFVAACGLRQLATPPGAGITPRECVGTFRYPDSAGVCIPKTPTDSGAP